MDATGINDSKSATSTLATASSANRCAAVDAAFMVAPYLSGTTSNGRGNFCFRGNSSILRGNDAFDYDSHTYTYTDTYANAVTTITIPGFSGGSDPRQEMKMKILQRISQCQHSHFCLLVDHEHLPSIADPQVAAEALVEVALGATAAEAPVQVVPVPTAVDAPAEGAVVPAAKKARQYDLATSATFATNTTPPTSTPSSSTSMQSSESHARQSNCRHHRL